MTGPALRSGLTLLETLVVTVAVAGLAGLALPRVGRALLEARAADTVAELEAVAAAAHRYRATHGDWPEEADPGRVPPGMEAFLPEGFPFDGDARILDWENWSGRPGGFVGITLVTEEEETARAVRARLGDAGTWSDGRTRVSRVVAWE